MDIPPDRLRKRGRAVGSIKTIISICILVWFISRCDNDIPEWAQLISFAMVLCGFIAHKED